MLVSVCLCVSLCIFVKEIEECLRGCHGNGKFLIDVNDY